MVVRAKRKYTNRHKHQDYELRERILCNDHDDDKKVWCHRPQATWSTTVVT